MAYSKKIRKVCILLFLTASMLYAQLGESIAEDTHIGRTETVSTVDESTIFIAQEEAPALPMVPSTASTVWLFVRMIFVLALVIACIYTVIWLMRRSMNKSGATSDAFLRVVSHVTLSPGKSVQIVSLLDEKAYILGVTDNAVNLIGEITNKEIIDAMNVYADKNANVQKPRTFNDMLSIFAPNTPKEKNIFTETGNKARDMLRRQRNRLDKTEQ
ncbi:MAG: flagellar biosynthetic protein FliO [Treponema sp.]|nr:flagellar biosynthetic protein FliO [Treponema sp.]